MQRRVSMHPEARESVDLGQCCPEKMNEVWEKAACRVVQKNKTSQDKECLRHSYTRETSKKDKEQNVPT